MRRAQQEAEVRYGGEARGLDQLLTEARQRLRSGVRFERGAAEGVIEAVRQARPQVRAVYAENARSLAEADQDVARDLHVLSSAADPFRAVAAREAAGAKARLAGALSGALTDLQQRKLEATSGAVYAQQGLRRQYREDVGKVRAQQQGLAGEVGAYVTGAASDIAVARAKARQERRAATGEAQSQALADEQTALENRKLRWEVEHPGKTFGGGGKDGAGGGGGGPSRGAISAHQGLMADIQNAVNDARSLGSGATAQDIVASLTAPKGPSKDAKGEDTGKSLVGGYDRLYAQAAAQIVADGYIHRNTLNQLRNRGLLKGRTPRRWRGQAPVSDPAGPPFWERVSRLAGQ